MADVNDLKANLILAAYTGAVAVCEPLIANPDGTQVQIDPLIKDIGLQQKDLLVYEVAKIHYAAILRAFHDKTGIWPDPQLASATTPPAKQAASTTPPATPGADLAGTIAQAAGTVANIAAAGK
jgi:hypothetical protein